MDDPWGSPWAVRDSDKDQKLASSPAKSDLAPPPRAFFSSSNSPEIPTVLEQSPWAGDNDGFGEWAAASDTPSAHSGWGGGWVSPNLNLTPLPRDDVLGKTSPIAWPENIATSKPTNGSAFRQPSPDPWASGAPSRRPSIDGASTPRLVVNPASPVDVPAGSGVRNDLGIVSDTAGGESSAVGAEEEQRGKAAEPSGPSSDPTRADSAEQDLERAGDHGDVQQSLDSAAHNPENQSSTASDEDTDHEAKPREFANASTDEEPRVHRAESRKVSGKVQELVVKFDGLARAASQERVPSRPRSRSPLSVGKNATTDDTGDFGDFEEADQDEPSTEFDTLEKDPPGQEPAAAVPPAVSPPRSPDRSPASESLAAKFGHPDFAVDPGAIERLFKTVTPGSARRELGVDPEIPDHIVTDCFTEISERKTWYRLSRLGSSRRHNAGDDDSYRRVAWSSSTVHDDTIKIVRRWMEEDSIAGRVALGGGISKTQKNMFGWDSNVEPVALDAVFGKKKSHSRASSLQTSQTAGLSSHELDRGLKRSIRSPTHRTSGSKGRLGASFSWSNGSTASETDARNPIMMPDQSTPASIAPSNREATQDSVSNLSRPASSLTIQPVTTAAASIEPVTSVQSDDDDEWGEMVSSPAAQKPAGPQLQIASGGLSSTPAPATRQSAGPSCPTMSESGTNMTSTASRLNGVVPNDPWSSADFSIFDSTPAQPAVTVRAATTHSPKPLVKDAISIPMSETPAISSNPGSLARLPDRAGVSTMHPALSESDNSHDEAANRILASFPDLSYMLR